MSGPRYDRERKLTMAFVELADTLIDDYDVIDLLDRLVSYCLELRLADAAGIMLADSQQILRLAAASSEESTVLELLQVQSGEGPCVESYRNASAVMVADVTELSGDAGRWPRFSAAVARQGAFRSVHALPLRLRGEAVGALNLFHGSPGTLPAADLALAQALADVATIGILQERAVHRGELLVGQLQTALNSRVVIEQAKGVLAQAGGLTMEAAFDRLRRFSRSGNHRLSDVAREVVNGDLAGQVLGVSADRP
ncbi:MAG TPA: GAF and ANTAR domain-containing protein [Pseudonocardiaceae bacterium]